MSIKLSFLPLWILPFIIIDGWKRRFLFIGTSVVFFLIIALPMTLRIGIFSEWVKNLFLYSGQYGSGDTNIVDFTSLAVNLKELWGYEKRFLSLFHPDCSVGRLFSLFQEKNEQKDRMAGNCCNCDYLAANHHCWQTLCSSVFHTCIVASTVDGFYSCRND